MHLLSLLVWLLREIQVVKFIHLFSFYSELPAYYFPTTNSNSLYTEMREIVKFMLPLLHNTMYQWMTERLLYTLCFGVAIHW